MFRKGLFVACFSLVAVLYLSGCGGSGPATLSVAVTASGTTVDATNSVTLTAAVTNDKNAAGVSWSVSGGGALSNTTTTSATYTAPAASNTALTVTVTATSVADATKTGTATITVPARPAITTGALIAGTVGTAYSATLAGSGGIAPYTWTITSGTLPAGLSMNSAGVISGTPTAAAVGTTNLTFVLTDSGRATALTANTTLGLTINAAPAIAFAGTVPATATYHLAYTGSAAATGGAGALTYSLAAGALPTGLALNTATGAITGTPTATGTFAFTIGAADAFGDSNTQAYSVVVSYAAVVVTPATLPTGYVGSVFHQATLAATGGSGTGFTFALASGSSLPAGLNLSAAGVISGTPTTSGTTNFTVTATDSASNTGNGNFSITVNAGVSITTALTLPIAYVDGNYSRTLAATGGSGTGYTWAVTSGSSLPAGLSLSTAGVLSGIPTATGTPSFGITATDSVGNIASATFNLTIAAGVSITSSNTLPGGYQGTAYPGATFTATGGTGLSYSWTWAAAGGSSIPAGLSLSTAGVVSGTPTASGTFSIVVTVTDSASNTASATVSLTVEATLAISTTSPLHGGSVNTAYSQTLAATGGSGTYSSWIVTTGAPSLAAINLSLSTAGVLSGTPTATGVATFTVQVTDSESHTATANFSVTVYAALTVTTATLPATNAGASYSQTLAAAGGSGAGYSWTATSSNLATYGLSLSTAGVVSGTPTQAGTATFTANVTDSGSNTAQAALSITIYSALSLPAPNPSSLPATGYTNVAYSGTISATGGSGSYSWQVTGLSDNLSSTPAGGTLTISGTPGASPTTVTFNVTLTDTTTGASVTQNGYSIVISTPTPVVLPTPDSTVPGPATQNQSYNGSITVTGGVAPYTWSINGTTVPGGGLALTNGLTATSSGGSSLSITGTPTTLTTVTLTNVKVTDNIGSNQTNTYSIAVNSAGSNVSGQVYLNSSCGGGSPAVPTITLTLLTSPGGSTVQTQTTDSNGNYTFTGIPNGDYSIVPSVAGANPPSSTFFPTAQSITVNNADLTGKFFNVTLGYTLSGTVNYSGSKTGQVYLLVFGNCGNTAVAGTSITQTTLTSGGAYTIRGVPPGTWTLKADMDNLGYGQPNQVNPFAKNSSVVVTNANVTVPALTLADPTTALPSVGPSFDAVIPTDQGVIIPFKAISNSSNSFIELVTSYQIQWSTDSTFASGNSTITLPAVGTNGTNVWILNNSTAGISGSFTNGTRYYFRARGILGGSQTVWTVYGGGTPTGVTIGQPSGAGYNTVTGTVYIPSTVTPATGAQLYVGYYSNGGIYAARIPNPTNAVGGNAFTAYVPNGTYQFFGILDQNNDGVVAVGDVTNTGLKNMPSVTVSGPLSGQSLTLPDYNSVARVTTHYNRNTSPSGTGANYNINIDLRAANKLPVSATLTAGPHLIHPVDMGLCLDCGNSQFQYSQTIGGLVPVVNDTYSFLVTYNDGTSETVTGKVTAVLTASQLATNLAPTGTSSASLTPTFTWTYPANPANYIYQFQLSDNSGNTLWQIPGNNSDTDGFTNSAVTQIVWGTDPTGDSSNTPSVSTLTNSVQYNWQIQTQDADGNSAVQQVYYIP